MSFFKAVSSLTIQSSHCCLIYLHSDLKNYLYTNITMQTFAAILFHMTKSWQQLRYLSIGKQINKFCFRNKNKLWSHPKSCINLKCIVLNERSSFIKTIYCMIPIIDHSEKDEIIKIINRAVSVRGLGGSWIHEAWRIFLTDFRVLKLFCMIQ